MRFEVFTAMKMLNVVFCIVTPCNLIGLFVSLSVGLMARQNLWPFVSVSTLSKQTVP
jgi:hypothetical protein